MADEAVEEFGQLLAERLPDLVGQGVDFGERVGQSVRDLHVPASELPQQLHVVIAGHAEGRSAAHHVAHQPHGVENPRAAIDEIADEDGFPALRDGRRAGAAEPDRPPRAASTA